MRIADGIVHMDQVRSLLFEYTRQLGRDLTFQQIEEELKNPAAKYAAPHGAILVALEGGDVAGMVAYRRHSAVRCEMKRLYVRPCYRGLKIGERLARAIVERAITDGYREMVLDTLVPMHSARRLYAKLGFEPCTPYYNNPMADVIYLKKELCAAELASFQSA